MFHATTIRIAARTASGIWLAYGASRSIRISKVAECTMPASGVLPPLFTLAAVRAMTPVGGNPAENDRRDVGDSLRHQFAVALMSPADHSVGHDRAKQRFDRTEQSDRRRFRNQRIRPIPRD